MGRGGVVYRRRGGGGKEEEMGKKTIIRKLGPQHAYTLFVFLAKVEILLCNWYIHTLNVKHAGLAYNILKYFSFFP